MSSSWNTHFHKNQAYDTSYNNNEQGISMPQPQNFSSFPYEHVQDHENDNINNNMSDKRQSFSNKVEINEDSSASFLSTSPRQSVTNTGVAVEKNKDLIMSPVSLQFQDPRGPTQQRETYNRQSESDEELARRLHREETESYHRDIMGSSGQVGGLYSPQGEAAAYYSTMGDQGQTVSGAPVQGTATDIKRNSKIPKAYSNPLVTVQLEKMEKRRLSRWRKPYFTWIVTIIQLALFIAEFIKNKELYGTAIQTTPFNPMIGPSALTLIQLGARFNPCMRTVKLPDSFAFECPPKLQEELHTQTCSLEMICGFNGFKDGVTPDQWFRFITPIFVHAGVIHFLFNMLFQLITGSSVEVDIGSWRYGIIYMASGIFGFIFGGNFAEPTIPSMGASGALFGVIGILLIDIFQNWRLILNPCWELTKLLLMIVISFLIGLLPGLDNFSHIGGFLMGILTGLILLRSIDFSKFHKWATWILRIAAIPIAVLLYFFLIQNFYSNDPREKCPWCKYLSCLPVLGWCDETGLRTN